ncbi:MAG: low molecular weight protein-tyrosine-phosphatase [Rhodospirillales bacterium]|nr:low molecular weight protein-tyrosine-phosphatase [Rhodospirillales bacterium]
MIKVLFVCLGNICRSPAAEAGFRALLTRHGLDGRILVDSAATSSMQIGKAPDPRTQAVAQRRGLDLADLRARQVQREDFFRFDHILAMDRANLEDLRAICPPGARARIGLFLEGAAGEGCGDVADPYLDRGLSAFERMFDQIETGCAGLLRWMEREHPDLFAQGPADPAPATAPAG